MTVNPPSDVSPSDNPIRFAVASRDGRYVHVHFGRATSFMIFDVRGSQLLFVETRATTPYCTPGAADDESHESQLKRATESLADCHAVIVMEIGEAAVNALASRGIKAFRARSTIVEAISEIVAHHWHKPS